MSQIRRHSDTPLSTKVQKRLKKVVKQASYASRYYEFRLKGKHPLRLLGTPKDPWMGSVAAGAHILSLRFFVEGQVLRNPDHMMGEWQAGEIWLASSLNSRWQEYLHSFCWLRDLNRVVDRKAARLRAMELTRHWLNYFDQWHDLAWKPDILGRRIVNWMAYAPLILDTNDLVYRSKLLNCLARQARHLYHTGDDQLRGLSRIRAIGGMVMAGLYIPYGESWLKKGTGLLKKALAEEIRSDGGTSSRNPEDIYRILRDLIIIRSSGKAMGHDPLKELDHAIGRMTGMLTLLTHGDGKLCLFNGASEQEARDIAATVKIARDLKGEGFSESEEGESGFRRLEREDTVIIADMGPPAEVDDSRNCHAGTLSFEMSRGKQRVIVNCGSANALPEVPEMDLYRLSRSTAAHSTVVLNDKNSSEIRKDGLIGRGPTLVESQCFDEKGHGLLVASHDGYVQRFGLLHRRMIYLSRQGDDIRGEDCLERQQQSLKGPVPQYDVRFHLHPDVTLSLQSGANRVLMRLPTGEFWQFQCSGAELTVEDSLYLGQGTKLQNCRQIILSGATKDDKTVIKWSLFKGEGTS